MLETDACCNAAQIRGPTMRRSLPRSRRIFESSDRRWVKKRPLLGLHVLEHASAKLIEDQSPVARIVRLGHGKDRLEEILVLSDMADPHDLEVPGAVVARTEESTQSGLLAQVVAPERIREPCEFIAHPTACFGSVLPSLDDDAAGIELCTDRVVLREKFVPEADGNHGVQDALFGPAAGAARNVSTEHGAP
jgi:hypothetical protein